MVESAGPSDPYSALRPRLVPSAGRTPSRVPTVLPWLGSSGESQPFATIPVRSTLRLRVQVPNRPVSLAGRASSKLNEVDGVRSSTSSSRSKPMGASPVPNVRLRFVALRGVKLISRASISVSVTGSSFPSCEIEVVSWP